MYIQQFNYSAITEWAGDCEPIAKYNTVNIIVAVHPHATKKHPADYVMGKTGGVPVCEKKNIIIIKKQLSNSLINIGMVL